VVEGSTGEKRAKGPAKAGAQAGRRIEGVAPTIIYKHTQHITIMYSAAPYCYDYVIILIFLSSRASAR
jgi:hypothetical protein